MKSRSITCLITITLILLPFFSFFVLAAVRADDNIVLSAQSRTIEVKNRTNETEIVSTSTGSGAKNSITTKITYGADGLGVSMSFEAEAETTSTETDSEITFKIIFTKIVEFKSNGGGSYDDDVDQLLQTMHLNSFNALVYNTNTTTSGIIVHYFSVSSKDGNFTVNIYIPEQRVMINSSYVETNEAKININIKNFAFSNIESKLAVETVLESSTDCLYEADTENDDENSFRTVSAKGYPGVFYYNESSLIDGDSKSIRANYEYQKNGGVTFLNNEMTYLNYLQGANIIHYTRLMVSTTPELNIFLLILLIGGVAIAGIAGVITYKKLKYRKYMSSDSKSKKPKRASKQKPFAKGKGTSKNAVEHVLSMPKKCPRCQKMQEGDAKLCLACGWEFFSI